MPGSIFFVFFPERPFQDGKPEDREKKGLHRDHNEEEHPKIPGKELQIYCGQDAEDQKGNGDPEKRRFVGAPERGENDDEKAGNCDTVHRDHPDRLGKGIFYAPDDDHGQNDRDPDTCDRDTGDPVVLLGLKDLFFGCQFFLGNGNAVLPFFLLLLLQVDLPVGFGLVGMIAEKAVQKRPEWTRRAPIWRRLCPNNSIVRRGPFASSLWRGAASEGWRRRSVSGQSCKVLSVTTNGL